MKQLHYKIKYIVEYFDEKNNFWQEWIDVPTLTVLMFNSRKGAIILLKAALDTKGTPYAAKNEFLFNTKYRTRQIFKYENEYTGMCQPINI